MASLPFRDAGGACGGISATDGDGETVPIWRIRSGLLDGCLTFSYVPFFTLARARTWMTEGLHNCPIFREFRFFCG